MNGQANPKPTSSAPRVAKHRLGLKHDLREIRAEIQALRSDVRMLVEAVPRQHQPAKQDHRYVSTDT